MDSLPKRYLLAKASVFFWVNSGIKKIVVCDSTDTPLLTNTEISMIESMDIKFEQIHFPQNHEQVIEKGKGYGEGSILSYSLQNSSILSQEDSFYKCTSKVYCRNFIEINKIISSNNVANIFWKDPLLSCIDTRFFYLSKEFCKEKIIPIYNDVNDRKGAYIELLALDLAQKTMLNSKSLRPLLSGFSGSTDQYYFDESLGFLDRNFPCWITKKDQII